MLSFFLNKQEYVADEIGVLSPNQMQVSELYAGEVTFVLPYLTSTINLMFDYIFIPLYFFCEVDPHFPQYINIGTYYVYARFWSGFLNMLLIHH